LFKSVLLVIAAMVAFAANSLLCRMALVNTNIDPSSFTIIRLLSGAVSLLVLSIVFYVSQSRSQESERLIAMMKQNASVAGGIALFVYALCFSFAYISMATGTGALLLFGTVQVTMIAVGLIKGERFTLSQWLGFSFAIIGLVILLLPSSSAPSMLSAILMILAGFAWGAYSLIGKSATSPLVASAGNFVIASALCVPLAAVVLLTGAKINIDPTGSLYALASGMLASGAGYAIWYASLPSIKSTTAATVQLSVPIIATFMGWAILKESLNITIIVASLATLGGILLVIRQRN
jgi:drug/metabolite transporter (DMT)-like permease